MSVGADVSTAPRALRYGLLTSALAVLVCAALALVAGTALASALEEAAHGGLPLLGRSWRPH